MVEVTRRRFKWLSQAQLHSRKLLSIDDIITEAFERLGFFDYSGNDLKSARRSLNIMFQEWDNRGLHFWEVVEQHYISVGNTHYLDLTEILTTTLH